MYTWVSGKCSQAGLNVLSLNLKKNKDDFINVLVLKLESNNELMYNLNEDNQITLYWWKSLDTTNIKPYNQD